jgi:formate/nitrite transporter FocA (FNT family)
MYEQMLAYLNVSQSTLENIILITVAVLILGTIIATYYKFLIAGAVACFCFSVFTHSAANSTGYIITEKSERVEYMEDCFSLTQNKKMCEELWKERNE